MNARTSKLLRAYALMTGKQLPQVKRDWNTTPASQRGAVRLVMESGLWSTQLRTWREQNNLIQKEAADYLQVSVDTYRGWENMKTTPAKYVRIALKPFMAAFPIQP